MLRPAIVTVDYNKHIQRVNRAAKCKLYMRDHLKKETEHIENGLYFYGINDNGKMVKIPLY